MANRRNKKRINDLEQDMGGGDDVKITVNWSTDPDMMLDEDTGEYVTEQEWKRRNPNIKLKIVDVDSAWD